jgi:trehalose 6-phosphate synthase
LAIGVDRLDYTKGIEKRLDAIGQFFERNPDWQGRFTFVQVASESRSQIPAYREVQADVTESVESINDRFGTDDWQPIVYTTERVPRSTLLGLYNIADMAIVSAIRDGLNLVAQEYVAAQTDDDGVLLLSQNAGAYELLGQETLTIEPHDTRQFSSTITAALDMPRTEKRQRMRALRQSVAQHDLQQWVESQLDVLRQPQRRTRPE